MVGGEHEWVLTKIVSKAHAAGRYIFAFVKDMSLIFS
jgi:hypothetical protein